MSALPCIRQRLRDGHLPRESSPIVCGHPGTAGGLCDACSKLILKCQLVMDIPRGDRLPVHLHAGCYIMWNAERLKVEQGAA